MSQMFTGSICLTELVEQAKKGHSAFSKANNGKIYFNILEWLNDEPDKYGNVISIQLNSSKEKKDAEGKIYIGNCKALEQKPITQNKVNTMAEEIDDLPF